jgi:ribosome-associated protein
MSQNTQNKESKELVKAIIEICEDVKAIDINTFEIDTNSSIADYYIICTGNSEPHIKAIRDRLEQDMKNAELAATAIDGGASSQWIVMDFHSVIVHIMHPEAREYYNLEQLWNSGHISPEKLPWECTEAEVLTSEKTYRRQ